MLIKLDGPARFAAPAYNAFWHKPKIRSGTYIDFNLWYRK
jgi:hypothetical protein